mgnify:FL=1
MITRAFILILLLLPNFVVAQIGIGTADPDSSSLLELQSNNRGFLLPRVALTDVTDTSTIPSPADGLMVYNLSSNCSLAPGLYLFDGSSWRKIKYQNNITYARLIKNHIGIDNVTFSYINSTYHLAPFSSLFDGEDNVQDSSFHAKRDGNPSGDWGFKISLPKAYFITSFILDGRDDCCTDRIVNVEIKLYRCGSLKYTSPAITSATTGDNIVNIPDIYADEIRLVIPNGGDSGDGSDYINFSELSVLAYQ